MRPLHNLKVWVSPPTITDPLFGKLIFMHIEKHPERSYWEGKWELPGTGYPVEVFLAGGEDGPVEAARSFYLTLPDRFERIIEQCRPLLARVFSEWLNRDLPTDLFSELNVAAFNVDDPKEHPLRWSVSFETTGAKRLGITIPFVDDVAGDAEVNT